MEALEQLFNISGKTALVTGGSSGIGAMITEALVMAGCRVFIASRKQESLDAVANELNALGKGSVETIAADLSSAEGTEALVAALKEKTDHINILVNNSGATWGDGLDQFPRKAWDKILNLNVTAMADLTRLMLPLLEAQASDRDPARVINIGSVMGTRPHAAIGEMKGHGAYSYVASKAAVHHLTKMYSNELAHRHITVNAIAPGPFPSRMMKFATDSEEKRDFLGSTVPLGRIGEPADMACAVRWLCSKGGAYITGNILAIDGGMSAMP